MKAPIFQHTPKSIKRFIFIICSVSILSPLLSFFMENFFHKAGPNAWLALSLHGIQRGWLWQLFTYFFIHTTTFHITLSFLIALTFLMYLLWFSARDIIFRFAWRGFLLLYFSAGIFAALVTVGFLFIFSSPTLVATSSSAVFATLTVWLMLNHDLEFYYLLLVRIKAKWVVGIILGFSLLMHLSFGEFAVFVNELSGIIWGYFFGRMVWKLPSLTRLGLFKKQHTNEKIIDIRSIESDDIFMDRMLEKISSYGESSLSASEKKRMHLISKKKRG